MSGDLVRNFQLKGTEYNVSAEIGKASVELHVYEEHAPSGKVLKVYQSAWEQGWDNYKIPEVFQHVENVLKAMPLRPCIEEDLYG